MRDHLERLMPPEGRARRLVGWGVVAWTALGFAALVWAAWKALAHVSGVLPFLIVAFGVLFVLNPVVRGLVRRGIPRRLAATTVFGVAVILAAVLVDLAVPALISQSHALAAGSPAFLRGQGGMFAYLSHSSDPLLRRAGETAGAWLSAHAGNVSRDLQVLIDAGLRLAHAGLVLLLGGFLGFLLLLSWPETSRGLGALIPASAREAVWRPLQEMRRIVMGYLGARLIVSAVVGLVTTVGLWLIGMPFWLVLGLVVGVANLIPMLGSWIGGIPVVMVALATKPPSFLIPVLAVLVVAHLIDGYILSPVVLRGTTRLHPLVVLLAMLLGAELAGLWGVLAAIPAAGVVQFMLGWLVVPRLRGEAGPSAEEAP